MIERITRNEERLDNIIQSINKLEEALNEFKSNKRNMQLLNKYYGSSNWFKDKEVYKKGKLKDIKAGVLSEDAVWNMHEDISELVKEMEKIVKDYKKEGDK